MISTSPIGPDARTSNCGTSREHSTLPSPMSLPPRIETRLSTDWGATGGGKSANVLRSAERRAARTRTTLRLGTGAWRVYKHAGRAMIEYEGRAAGAGEVRKTVTVLFVDVTGSNELGERLDPESLRQVMTRYFDVMRAALERHGGTVEKFIGDAVMAVFGIPRLHEDDALRAVRAAADMQQELAVLNGELERGWGVTISIRIGVN